MPRDHASVLAFLCAPDSDLLRPGEAWMVTQPLHHAAGLLTVGMTDPRVDAWHGAKMAARLQRASRSGRPVLLRVAFDAGHGLGSTRSQLDDEYTDAFAFALWCAGRRSVA